MDVWSLFPPNCLCCSTEAETRQATVTWTLTTVCHLIMVRETVILPGVFNVVTLWDFHGFFRLLTGIMCGFGGREIRNLLSRTYLSSILRSCPFVLAEHFLKSSSTESQITVLFSTRYHPMPGQQCQGKYSLCFESVELISLNFEKKSGFKLV